LPSFSHPNLALLTACLITFLCDAHYSVLKKEAAYSSETLVGFQRIARLYIPDDKTLRSHRCDNFKLKKKELSYFTDSLYFLCDC
jgi:hypothetical protein